MQVQEIFKRHMYDQDIFYAVGGCKCEYNKITNVCSENGIDIYERMFYTYQCPQKQQNIKRPALKRCENIVGQVLYVNK